MDTMSRFFCFLCFIYFISCTPCYTPSLKNISALERLHNIKVSQDQFADAYEKIVFNVAGIEKWHELKLIKQYINDILAQNSVKDHGINPFLLVNFYTIPILKEDLDRKYILFCAKYASLANDKDKDLIIKTVGHLIKVKSEKAHQINEIGEKKEKINEELNRINNDGYNFFLYLRKKRLITFCINTFCRWYNIFCLKRQYSKLKKEQVDIDKEIILLEHNVNELCEPNKKIKKNLNDIMSYSFPITDCNFLDRTNSISKRSVQKQQDAECGLHALCNAINNVCIENISITLDELKNKIIESIRKVEKNVNWLSADELSHMLKTLFTSRTDKKLIKNITILPDLSFYLNKNNCGITKKIIKRIATIQQVIHQRGEYKHLFILGTMNGVENARAGHESKGHWVAVEVNKNAEGLVRYITMDSLPGSDAATNLAENLKVLLEGSDHVIKKIIKDKINVISNLMSVIEMSRVFKKGKYAFFGEEKEDVLVRRVFPYELIERIIESCSLFLDLVKTNEPFYCNENYVESPYGLVKEALDAIENAQEIQVKMYTDDDDKDSCIIHLEKEHFANALERLRKRIEE